MLRYRQRAKRDGHLAAKDRKPIFFAAQEANSYMAGQRAALMEAFQLMLPGQQQLGSMANNLQRLQSQVLALHACAEDQMLDSCMSWPTAVTLHMQLTRH